MDWQSLYVVDFFMQIGAFEPTEGIVNNVWLISRYGKLVASIVVENRNRKGFGRLHLGLNVRCYVVRSSLNS